MNPFSPQFPQKLHNPPYQWYVYLGLIAGFTLFGLIVQAITNRQPKQEKTQDMPLLENSGQRVELPSKQYTRSQTLREKQNA